VNPALENLIRSDAEFAHHLLNAIRTGHLARPYGGQEQWLWVSDYPTAYRTLASEDAFLNCLRSWNLIDEYVTRVVYLDDEPGRLVWLLRLTPDGTHALHFAQELTSAQRKGPCVKPYVPRAGELPPACSQCRAVLATLLGWIAGHRILRSTTAAGTFYTEDYGTVAVALRDLAEVVEAIIDAGHAREENYTVPRRIGPAGDDSIRLVPLVLTASGSTLTNKLN
jgi:hypothetical protein